MNFITLLIIVLPFISNASSDLKDVVFVEAESFSNTGGWEIDQQSMDQMGSSYLLAHGLGVPVENATSEIKFSEVGVYHVWVRTRNWAPAEIKKQSPGQFKILVNGHPLDTVFGRGKEAWHWRYGGEIDITSVNSNIEIHDLTGFEGRCDAIVFSKNPNQVEHQSENALLELRKKALGFSKKPKHLGNYDLVVVGGGIAGMSASISAARLGLKVALIQNRPVLGGNNSSEIRVYQAGKLYTQPYPAIGNITKEIDATSKKLSIPNFGDNTDNSKLSIILNEPNISLFAEMHVGKVELKNSRLQKVFAKNIRTGEEFSLGGKYFADCTGDGNLGFLAGADFKYGREPKSETGELLAPLVADSMVLGSTLYWYSKEDSIPSEFPKCPWAFQFTEESCQDAMQSAWNWETGFSDDMITDTEQIRDRLFRAIYGNWSFQKNHPEFKEKYKDYQLEWMAYILGKRESRRLVGDILFSQNDITEDSNYPDACVSSTWGIDIHYADPENSKYFPGEEFRSAAYHPLKQKHPERSLPCRSFYSRNIDNLFMAGRCASMTHIAHAMFRVQHTTGMMGEVVGIAASLCEKNNCSPKELYENHLNELLHSFETGVPLN